MYRRYSWLGMIFISLLITGCPKKTMVSEQEQDFSDITDIQWVWQYSTLGNQPAQTPEDSHKYYVLFKTDSEFSIQADCNRGRGELSAEKNQITLKLLMLTRAYCGETSLDQDYLQQLSQVETWVLNEKGQLKLNMAGSNKFMLFNNGN